jgi:hypothetical protein
MIRVKDKACVTWLSQPALSAGPSFLSTDFRSMSWLSAIARNNAIDQMMA